MVCQQTKWIIELQKAFALQSFTFLFWVCVCVRANMLVSQLISFFFSSYFSVASSPSLLSQRSSFLFCRCYSVICSILLQFLFYIFICQMLPHEARCTHSPIVKSELKYYIINSNGARLKATHTAFSHHIHGTCILVYSMRCGIFVGPLDAKYSISTHLLIYYVAMA